MSCNCCSSPADSAQEPVQDAQDSAHERVSATEDKLQERTPR